jgi:glycosyltransferase involved in cell wall biosynthesis
MTISVVILTYNEEAALPGCLDSVRWCDDVVVFDSHSTDRTRAIASESGARVALRQFDDFASQRNAALAEPFKHPWVLMLDADERVPSDLAREMTEAVVAAADDVGAFRMRRKDMWGTKWLRRSTGYPTWFARLVRVGQVKVSRPVNESYDVQGRCGVLESHLLHYPFLKGLSWWVARHNQYSSSEAAIVLAERRDPVPISSLFDRDPVIRRRTLKLLSHRVPARPLMVFAYLFVLRGGFLDGIPGLRYSLLRSWYEMMIDLKIAEVSTSADPSH